MIAEQKHGLLDKALPFAEIIKHSRKGPACAYRKEAQTLAAATTGDAGKIGGGEATRDVADRYHVSYSTISWLHL